MRRLRFGVALLAAQVLVGCLHAPVLWSPDGQWLAYTMAVRPEQPGLTPGWLFATAPPEAGGMGQAGGPVGPRLYRLWATRPEGGESVLLEESRGPLTAPSWSPDGQALAFGRLVPEEEGRGRFEVVIQEAPDRKRVVLVRSVDEFHARAEDLPGLGLAWSPDGRFLAVPLFQQSLSLGIIRADNGRLHKVIEDAYLPAWSPDGTKLAFVQGNDAESLHYIDRDFGAPRHLADIGHTSQAPVWYRDSRSVAILARRTAQFRRRDPPAQQIDLLRVHIESGRIDLVNNLLSEPGDRDKVYKGSSFSLDRDGDELYYVSDVEGQLTEITCFRPRTGETAEKFHPIDPMVRLGALALSPSGKTLALRVGSPGDLSPPALLDRETKEFTPLVPDDAARVEWLATLVRTAQLLLRAHLPATDAQNVPIDRPTLLPVLGELPINHEVEARLRRIGRIGRPLCERPADAAPASGAMLDVLAEARLFFDVLREDYNAALESLEALEPRLTTRDHRLALLGVRAQIFLGQKRFEQANQTIAFLLSIEAQTGQRIEQTPTGLALIPEAGRSRRWASYLVERTGELVKASRSGGFEMPLGNRNPDNPNPNADLVPGPAGGAIPFAPLIQVAPPFMPLLPEFEQQAAAIMRQRVPPPPPHASRRSAQPRSPVPGVATKRCADRLRLGLAKGRARPSDAQSVLPWKSGLFLRTVRQGRSARR